MALTMVNELLVILAVDRDYTAVKDSVGSQFLYVWYMIGSVDSTGRINMVLPV